MKNFDEWNIVKKNRDSILREEHIVYCKEKEVWWISLGLNVGDEEDGKGELFERPVLVIKKFNNNLFWGCALSTKIKENNKYYIKVKVADEFQSVIISQLRLYDSKRLQDKIAFLSEDDFNKTKTAIKKLL